MISNDVQIPWKPSYSVKIPLIQFSTFLIGKLFWTDELDGKLFSRTSRVLVESLNEQIGSPSHEARRPYARD